MWAGFTGSGFTISMEGCLGKIFGQPICLWNGSRDDSLESRFQSQERPLYEEM